MKYYAAIDYQHEGDLFREWNNNRGYTSGYGFNRINVRSNLDFQLTKTTTLKANLSGSHGIRKSPYGLEKGSWAESQLWQAAYSELVEMDVLWPDFTRSDLDAAIEEFNHRSRRFGGL